MLYTPYKEALLSGASAHASHVEPLTHTLKWALLTVGYVGNAAHQFVTDLGANILARSGALSGKAITNGILVVADYTFTAPPAGTFTQLALYRDTGADGTSPLMYLVTAATGLPRTTSGQDVVIRVDPTGHRVFEV